MNYSRVGGGRERRAAGDEQFFKSIAQNPIRLARVVHNWVNMCGRKLVAVKWSATMQEDERAAIQRSSHLRRAAFFRGFSADRWCGSQYQLLPHSRERNAERAFVSLYLCTLRPDNAHQSALHGARVFCHWSLLGIIVCHAQTSRPDEVNVVIACTE